MPSDRNRADALRRRIQAAYAKGSHHLGWRLLYSPAAVLEGAKVAFMDLNPGGDEKPVDHAEFCMETGSAYADECWGRPPGQGPLQRQVLGLFEMVGAAPDAVLAGNLVPFRSPSWDTLRNRDAALAFGMEIWRDILAHARPRLVIGMGGVTNRALMAMLGVTAVRTVPVGWGNVTAVAGTFGQGRFVGLPHLSRFRIVGRTESTVALRQLFSVT